jgi:hypothetical protein
MNFTKALAGNFSNIIVNCEIFGENAGIEALNRYKSYNNNTADTLLSFLFNMMGSSLQFKSILDAINEDLKN